MEQQPAPKANPDTNLLAQFAKRKLEAQKSGENIGHFGKKNSGYSEKAQPFIPRGGRNGQGKP
jgi:hypothetical protein